MLLEVSHLENRDSVNRRQLDATNGAATPLRFSTEAMVEAAELLFIGLFMPVDARARINCARAV